MKLQRSLVVVTDLDGTFLDSSGQLPEGKEVKEFLSILRANDAELIVATSRSPDNVVELCAPLAPFTGICCDGAITIMADRDGWEVVHEESLPASAITVIDEMSRCQVPEELFLFGTSRLSWMIFHLQRDIETAKKANLQILVEQLKERRPIQQIQALVETRSAIEMGNVRAVSWFATHDEVNASAHIIMPVLERFGLTEVVYPYQYLERRYPSHSWLDIISAESTKGKAVQRLTRDRSIRSWVIALGDGINDVSLFEVADVSVCPRGAAPAAKRSAKYLIDAECGSEFIRAITGALKRDSHLSRGL